MLQSDLKSGAQEPLVEVLLATYNGERYLREQIDSIFAQDYKNLQILVRDDGSTDGTISILEEYAARFPDRFRIAEIGPATGSAQGNFLQLMRLSSAQYVSFADQDDVWFPDKLRMSMDAMRELETRWGESALLLVFTDLHVVDQELKTVHASFWKYTKVRSENIEDLRSLIHDAAVTGSTALVNRNLLQVSSRMNEDAMMHDWWMSLVACTMGRAKALQRPTVYYRQHDRNVFGAHSQIDFIEKWLRRVRKIAQRRQMRRRIVRQAEAFLSIYSDDLPRAHRETILEYLRCYEAKNRAVRASLFIRYGFFEFGSARCIAEMFDI